MASTRTTLLWAALATVALVGAAGCGSDDGGSTATTSGGGSATTAGGPTTTDGGGGMQAGAPRFTSFDVSSSVPCSGGNATATMSFSTENVVEIEIKIGDGSFASTAGYGPNETSVVASIPCSGAGSSSIQLRGCTEDHECADSEQKSVEITG
jgi:hypothetical protein